MGIYVKNDFHILPLFPCFQSRFC